MVSSLNELDRLARQRNQQGEAEQRIAEKRAFDKRQSEVLATAKEIRRKIWTLLQLLRELGAPDAEFVVVTEQVTVGKVFKKTVDKEIQMAAWFLYGTRGTGFVTTKKYFLLSDGRIGMWDNPFYRVPLPLRCRVVDAGSDQQILAAVERLIGTYS